MDPLTLIDSALVTARAALDCLLHPPIGHAPQLKALPLVILSAVNW